MPLGSPRPAARDGRRRTPGESLSPKEVSSLEDGPGEWCQHSVQLEAHLPWVERVGETKPLSGLVAQAWPSLEVESKT